MFLLPYRRLPFYCRPALKTAEVYTAVKRSRSNRVVVLRSPVTVPAVSPVTGIATLLLLYLILRRSCTWRLVFVICPLTTQRREERCKAECILATQTDSLTPRPLMLLVLCVFLFPLPRAHPPPILVRLFTTVLPFRVLAPCCKGEPKKPTFFMPLPRQLPFWRVFNAIRQHV